MFLIASSALFGPSLVLMFPYSVGAYSRGPLWVRCIIGAGIRAAFEVFGYCLHAFARSSIAARLATNCVYSAWPDQRYAAFRAATCCRLISSKSGAVRVGIGAVPKAYLACCRRTCICACLTLEMEVFVMLAWLRCCTFGMNDLPVLEAGVESDLHRC